MTRPAIQSRVDERLLRRWGLWCILAVLGACAAVLAWRRFTGGLNTPLSGPVLCLVGVLAAGAAAAARIASRRERPDLSFGRRQVLAAAGPTIALLALGLAVSLPGTSSLALIAFWGILVAEECWTWRLPSRIAPWLSRRSVSLSTQERRQEAGRTGDEAAEALPADDILQQFVRCRTPDGSEVVSGWVRVPLAAGQRSAAVHLAFCPPFARAPEIDAVQRDGPEARITLAQSLPYGARFDLKITSPSSDPAAVLLQFSAQAGPPLSDQPQAIAVAVVRHAGRVLIGQRAPGVPLAGLWEFPGGKVRPGETPQEAAARECAEETNLTVRIGQPYPEAVHQYEHGRVRLHFFAAEPVDPSQAPAAPFRWVSVRELAHYEFPPANAAILSRLLDDPDC